MRSIGHVRGLSLMLQNLGIAHAEAGQRERAVELLTESVAVARRAGDPGARELDAAHAGAAAAGRRRAAAGAGDAARGDAALAQPQRAPGPDRVARDAVGGRRAPGRPAHRRAADRRGRRVAHGGRAASASPTRMPGSQRVVADLREALGDEGFAAAEAEGPNSTSPTRSRARWRSAHADVGAHALLLVAEQRAVERVGPGRELEHERAGVARGELDACRIPSRPPRTDRL